jgi:hypothetical protein
MNAAESRCYRKAQADRDKLTIEVGRLRAVLRKMMADWNEREGWIAPETWARARELLGASTGNET